MTDRYGDLLSVIIKGGGVSHRPKWRVINLLPDMSLACKVDYHFVSTNQALCRHGLHLGERYHLIDHRSSILETKHAKEHAALSF